MSCRSRRCRRGPSISSTGTIAANGTRSSPPRGKFRRAHKALLAGRHSDVRAAGTVHDEAVESAMKATLDILARSPSPVDRYHAARDRQYPRALPAADGQPGRLAKTVQPGGFEMLAGFAIGDAGKASPKPAANRAHPARSAAPQTRAREPQSKAVAAARQEVASSEHALRDAEQAVRREEFESARATREERRAADAVEKARRRRGGESRTRARRGHAQGRAEIREESERGIPKARAAVTAAEKRSQAAAAALKKLTGG